MPRYAAPLRFSPSQEMTRPSLELHCNLDPVMPLVSLHTHLFYEFYIFAGGSLDRYVIGQKNYQLEPGDILVMPPGVLHHPIFTRGGDKPYYRYFFWATSECLEDILQFDAEADYAVRCCIEQEEYLIRLPELQRRQVLSRLDEAWDQVVSHASSSKLPLMASFLSFLCTVNDFVLSTGGRLDTSQSQRNDAMNQLLTYVHDNFGGDLTLQTIADHFFMSPSSVENMFRKLVGKPFYSYVTEYRIITAQTLILEDVPLHEVARQCGYSDYSNFYKSFRKRVGVSPSAFRSAVPPDNLHL